jgi:D-alanyl-D-alanine carboxypeptidase
VGKRYQRSRKGRYIWLLTIGIALVLTSGCDDEDNCANTNVQALQSAIDNFTANGIAPDPQTPDIKTPLPGILLGITLDAQDNCTLVSGASQIDTSTGSPTAPLFHSDKIRIGSITKTFVATLILDLVNNQKLSLDDTLNTYLPELNVPYGDTITIKQLLNMTSGVPNYLSNTDFFTNYYTNPGQSYTPEELVAVALQSASQLPGMIWSYSNTNYILLGLIAEEVVPGFTLEDQMQSLINNLGLLNTTFPGDTTSIAGRHSHGYSSQYVNSSFDPNTILDETASNPTSAWAAGAMISTLGDQMFWIQDLIQNAQENPARLQGNQGDISGLPVCYGLGLMDLTFNNAHYIGHGGEIIGYTGVVFYRPDKNAYISIFINRFVISDAVLGTPDILSEVVSILWPDESASVTSAIRSFRHTVLPEELGGLMTRQSSTLTSCTISLSQ